MRRDQFEHVSDKTINAIRLHTRLNAKAKDILGKDMLCNMQQAVLQDRGLMQYFGLVDIAKTGNTGSMVAMRKNDALTTLDPAQSIAQKKLLLWFQAWCEKKGYKRHADFMPKPEYEQKYKEAISQFSVDSVIYNRVYEMMVSDLIRDVFIQEYKDSGYQFYIKKTSLYDDVLSKTDAILTVFEPESKQYQNIAIDIHTSQSEHAHQDKKSERSKTICPEYAASIRKWSPIDRYVCHINPEASYKLLKFYYEKVLNASVNDVASGKVFRTGELYNEYREIMENNPEYRTGLDKGSLINIIDSNDMNTIVKQKKAA